MSKVIKGDHLTITKSSNGQMELSWDWDALIKEVAKATQLNIVKETEKKVAKTRKKK